MLMIIYLLILASVLALITVNMFRKKDSIWFQIDAALVMVTLILRLILVK